MIKEKSAKSAATDISVAPAPKKTTVTKEVVPRKSNLLLFVIPILVIVLFGGVFWLFSTNRSRSLPEFTASPQPQVLTLKIDSPADGTLAVENEILVKGSTLPQTTVVIYTENDEVLLTSDALGFFESTVKLDSGINSLNISAFGDDGSEKQLSLDVVYDQES